MRLVPKGGLRGPVPWADFYNDLWYPKGICPHRLSTTICFPHTRSRSEQPPVLVVVVVVLVVLVLVLVVSAVRSQAPVVWAAEGGGRDQKLEFH